MNNKRKFLVVKFVLLVAIGCCLVEVAKPQHKMTMKKHLNSAHLSDSNLINDWTLNFLLLDDGTIKCNVCPHIIFYNNGKGKTSTDQDFFKWHIEIDSLIVSRELVLNKTDSVHLFFEPGAYHYKLYTNNCHDITLELAHGKITYMLNGNTCNTNAWSCNYHKRGFRKKAAKSNPNGGTSNKRNVIKK